MAERRTTLQRVFSDLFTGVLIAIRSFFLLLMLAFRGVQALRA